MQIYFDKLLTLYIIKSQAIEIADGFGRVLPLCRPNGPWYVLWTASVNFGIICSLKFDWNATK